MLGREISDAAIQSLLPWSPGVLPRCENGLAMFQNGISCASEMAPFGYRKATFNEKQPETNMRNEFCAVNLADPDNPAFN